MKTNDDILFDRLVDGELPAGERRALLASLDSRPDGWRRCALAFLEAQSWQRECGQLVSESTSPTTSLSNNEHFDSRSRNGVRWLVLAASVFIAFTLGLAFGELPHPTSTVAPGPLNSLAANPTQQAGAVPRVVGAGDALTVWARDETGRAHPLRVPLVDAAALDRQYGLQFSSNLPANVRDHLQEHGYEVQSKQRYAPLWLDNGRPLILPVEDAKIVPVSNPVY